MACAAATTDILLRVDGDLLEKTLGEALVAGDVPGAVLAVRAAGRTRILAAGVTNRGTEVPVTPDTVFLIGSLSKLVTGALVLSAAECGDLDLDAPLHVTLSDGRSALRGRLPITAGQLLAHSSGLEGDHLADGVDPYGRGDDCLDRHAADVAHIPQLHPPGAGFSYSNNGYVLLGRVVEQLAGEAFDDVVRHRICEPLEMRAMGTLPEQAILHRVAVGHRSDEMGPPAGPWAEGRWVGPAGGVHATAGDVLRLACSLDPMSPARSILGRSIRQAALRPHVQVPVGAGRGDVVGTSWGLGWQLHRWGRTAVAGHNGWVTGQRAYLRTIPGADRTAVLLTNSDAGDAVFRALLPALCREVLDTPVPEALGPPVGADASSPAQRAACVGRYAANCLEVVIAERTGALVLRRDGEEEPLRLMGGHLGIGAITGTPIALGPPGVDGMVSAVHVAMRMLPRRGRSS